MTASSLAPARAVFLFSAPDRTGLVAKLASFFAELGLNILDASNHTDVYAARGPRFFMRLVVDVAAYREPRSALEGAFAEHIARPLGGEWSVGYSDVTERIAVLVTKEAACLYDLLLRQRQGELPCDVRVVIGNHPTLESVASSFGVPFMTLPVTPESKREQERRLLEAFREQRIDLVVLARYMQILSAELLAEGPPVINIHHGFLPAFQGAKPYHQAHTRGVKLIGATAHYATADLDQGPIIEQDVARVTHEMGPDELVRVGRDVERRVLSRAVRAHLERRVVVEDRRTIVF